MGSDGKERRLCARRSKVGAAARAGARDTRLGGELVLVVMGAENLYSGEYGGPALRRPPAWAGKTNNSPKWITDQVASSAVPERFPTARVLRVSLVSIVLMNRVALVHKQRRQRESQRGAHGEGDKGWAGRENERDAHCRPFSFARIVLPPQHLPNPAAGLPTWARRRLRPGNFPRFLRRPAV